MSVVSERANGPDRNERGAAMNSTAKTAELLNLTAEAEAALAGAQREQNAADRKAERAALRVTTQRTRRAEAVKNLRTAERAGKGIGAANRRVEIQTRQVADRVEAAREAKVEAGAARRAVRAAERRLNRLGLRAATAASRTVGKIAERLGKTSLSSAPAADRTLTAEEMPAVEEIEAHGDRFADLDAQAKDLAKRADAEKKWLRTLPVGTYGRVTINRVPGGTVLDGDQVALDYTARGLTPPRKGRRDTFKVLLAAEQAPAVAELLAA